MMAIRQIDDYRHGLAAVKSDESLFRTSANTPPLPINPDSVQILEGPMPAGNTVKRGSRVLEERLRAVRKELDHNTQEQNRLLEMARIQAERLAVIEPLPRLFLARTEGLLRVTLEQSSTEQTTDELAVTLEEMDKRFNQAIEQLRSVLNPKHLLENRDLRHELTQLQLALAAKREEVLGLRVEQEQLNQRFSAIMGTLQRSNDEAITREGRIIKLQGHIKDSEAKHQRLFVETRNMRGRGTANDPHAFTCAANNSGLTAITARLGLSKFVSLIIGIVFGCVLTFIGIHFSGLQLATAVTEELIQAPIRIDVTNKSALPAEFNPNTIQQDTLPSGRLGPELIAISGGKFLMGRYEVTFEQYDTFAQATGRYLPKDQGWGRGQNPVINVTWNDARAYTKWLSAKTGHQYRLPTEAEWEYAIAGGAQTQFWWGQNFIRGQEICLNCGTRWDGQQPAPVGSAVANRFGLYDMGGNVMEWVNDCAIKSCGLHVVRGGAYNKSEASLRSTTRRGLATQNRFLMVGFRVVRTTR